MISRTESTSNASRNLNASCVSKAGSGRASNRRPPVTVAARCRQLTIALGAVALLAMTGCAGMQAGSTARTAGEVFDDTYISGAINKALLSDAELSFLDINVDVHRGVVTLNGNATTAAAEQKLVVLAKSIRGVQDVKSRLIILPGTPNP